MFDSLGHLVIPIRVIGEGAYGTVYQAKRYNYPVSQRVLDILSGDLGNSSVGTLPNMGEGTMAPTSGRKAFSGTLPPVAPTAKRASDALPTTTTSSPPSHSPPIAPSSPPFTLVA
eukprot:PhF_6_TR29822/c0_g1_i1/m.43794